MGLDMADADKYIRSEAGMFDLLCGLPNRAYGMSLLEKHIAQAEDSRCSFILFLIGLDRFKEINENYGYVAGDEILAIIGGRLRVYGVCKHSVAVRMSGDLFVFGCQVENGDLYKAIDSDLRLLLSEPLSINAELNYIDASVGVAFSPNHGFKAFDLLKCAEVAMYQGKKMGGGVTVVYNKELGEKYHQRLLLGIRLEHAINNDKLTLVYQPKVDLKSRQMCGAEVLLRWYDQYLGSIPPSIFIPLAEERGQILLLGDLVLNKVCMQIKEWERSGLRIPERLAINVSSIQIADSNFAYRSINIVKKNDVRPQSIEFEITESGMMHEHHCALANSKILRDAGIMLSIDDFGTGFSSLERLHDFPFEKLKIDISFIRDLLTNKRHYAIVSAMLSMASALGLETIAEGVETAEQASELGLLGCTSAQGYYFSKPISSADFALNWLSRYASVGF